MSEVASSETGAVHGIIVGQVSQEAVRCKVLRRAETCATQNIFQCGQATMELLNYLRIVNHQILKSVLIDDDNSVTSCLTSAPSRCAALPRCVLIVSRLFLSYCLCLANLHKQYYSYIPS